MRNIGRRSEKIMRIFGCLKGMFHITKDPGCDRARMRRYNEALQDEILKHLGKRYDNI